MTTRSEATLAACPLDRKVGRLAAGMVCSVDFALGRAEVRLLPWSYNYRGFPTYPGQITGGILWHVEDIKTGHQDFVGEEWLTPNVALRGEPLAASPSRKRGSASAGLEKG